MDRVGPLRTEAVLARFPYRVGSRALTVLMAASAALFFAILVANLQRPSVILSLVIALAACVGAFGFALTRVSSQLHREQTVTRSALQASEEEFRQVAGNIQEVFWMIDVSSRRALYVNESYEAMTGRTSKSFLKNPSSFLDLIHLDDRRYVVKTFDDATRVGRFDERFRITRPDGEIRWVWVRGFPDRDSEGNLKRLLGTALDITGQKQAEEQVAANLALAKSAWAEEEALRKATLSLTQDLHMDKVMATLLRSLADVVPYTCARVIVPEGGPHWLALGERVIPESSQPCPQVPWTLVDDKCGLIRRIAKEKRSVVISDTKQEPDWPSFTGHKHLRSWLSVPLIASGDYLGFLSVGHVEANRLTQEHIRRAELLAIPAAVAIENARLYARSEIFASELTKRLTDLQAAESALLRAEGGRRVSEDRFQRVFHASPVPFSITTYREGKFVEVNAAFECRYGYSREDLLGRTVNDLRIWEDPSDRAYLLTRLEEGGPIRNVITRLRTRSGEIKTTAYSADKIEFDGQTCMLAVSEDVLQFDSQNAN